MPDIGLILNTFKHPVIVLHFSKSYRSNRDLVTIYQKTPNIPFRAVGTHCPISMDPNNQLKPYQYTLLSKRTSIRVLYILPNTKNKDLHVQLVEVDLQENPTYAALSYCWGEPKFDHLLFVEGDVLNITESLAGALRVLRNECETVIIWADAVCIVV